jgi:single-strand DNA-binding protein
MSVNKVIILGRLGQDPELKRFDDEKVMCKFSVATSDKWTDKQSGEQKESTEWHNVVAWGKIAELCNSYLSKGRQVYIEGKLKTISWDDDNGVKRYMTQVDAKSVQFIGSKDDGENKKDSPAKDYEPSENASFANDDIPF